MKILHLTLKRKWFDMILSGEKTEEYRDIKPYWIKRLAKSWNFLDRGLTIWEDGNEMFEPDFFVGVLFSNGYSKDSRKLSMFIESISIGEGREEWGAEPGKKYFVIKLKKIP